MLSTVAGFDIQFVQRQIAKYGLDPVAQRSHAIKVDGVNLTVERYVWGWVFHAADKGNDLSLTWLETDNAAPRLPGWARKARAFATRPQCLGHHEADRECDGGTDPETGEEERACAWRDRCMIVKRIAGKPESVESVLEQFTDEDLARKVEETKTRRRKQSPEVIRTRKARSVANYTSSVVMVNAFVARVMELGGWTLSPTRFRASAGQFFLRHYVGSGKARNDYMALFRRYRETTEELQAQGLKKPMVPGAGRMVSIVMLYPHSRNVRFSIQIRSEQEAFIRAVMPSHLQVRLGTYDKEHGRIVSVNRVTEADIEEVASGLVQVIQERKYDSVGAFPAIGTNAPRPWTQWSVLRGKR